MSGNAMNIYNFDMLQMYFGRDQYVTDVIGIKQPTIGQIVDYGEQQIYALIAPFIMNPTSCRVKLWDSGIDWNKISEWELFLSTYKTLIEYDTSIVFGDLDFASLKLYRDKNDGVFLFDPDSKVFINETVYTYMSKQIRTMFNMHPKVEKAKGKTTKEWIIEEEREKQRLAKADENNSRSTLLALVSAMVNHAGFKYKRSELEEIGIVEFMDSVQRLQVYENATALMSGIYSGMVDASKIDKNEFNWLRELYVA